jgi:hypothetical protein
VPPELHVLLSKSLEHAKKSESDDKSAKDDALDGRLTGVRDRVQAVGGKTFVLRADGRWVDTEWKGTPEPTKVEAWSKAWFDLLGKGDAVAKILAVGDRLVFVLDGAVYEVVPAPAPAENPK